MLAKVRGNKIEIKDPVTLVQGTVGQPMGVELPEAWDDLSVTAVFSAGAVQRDVPVLGREITIPWEVLTDPHAPLRLCFHAAAANGQRVITTANCDPVRIVPSTAPSGEEPEAPSPARADQIQALAQQALAAAQSVCMQAAQGAFDGVDGISPAVSVSEIQGGHHIQITDAGGTNHFDVLDGADGEVTEAELEAALASKADVNGSYDNMTVGNARQLAATIGIEDSTPYVFRTSGGSADIGDRETDMLVGGTIVWNQLVDSTDTSVTVASGHKYVANIAGAVSMGVSDGTALTVDGSGGDMVFDLTRMFGASVADYVYGLEQTTAGAGAAWFRKLFPKSRYAFNAGELMSVKTSEHRLVGFNLIDPASFFVGGTYNPSIGAKINLAQTGASVSGANPVEISVTAGWKGVAFVVPVLRGARYQLTAKATAPTAGAMRVSQYLIDDNNVVRSSSYNFNGTAAQNISRFFTPAFDGARCVLHIASTTAQKISVRDICLHLTWSGYRNGEYEPYALHSYPLDGALTLRGIPKLDANNNLCYDGDTYESDGTVTRKYEQRAYQTGDESLADAITDGTNTIVKLSSASTEAAEPFINPQIVNDFGTEEYVDTRDVAVPVGHETFYAANLRDKLQNAPDSPDTNGDYIMRRSGAKNSYVPLEEVRELPAAPSANGTYCLRVTVSGGAAVYSWALV